MARAPAQSPALLHHGGLAAFSFLEALDGSDIGIIITDAAGRVVWASEAIEAYFHLSRGDVIGVTWREFLACFVRPVLAHPLPGTLEAAGSSSERLLLDVQDGPAVRHLEHWRCAITQGGFAGGGLHHFIDVTRRLPRPRSSAHVVFDLASRSIAAEGK